MYIKKAIYIAIGMICVGLGFLGAMLPILPTVPFLFLATICFGKSSERLQTWFIGTKLYEDNLADFMRGEGMTQAAKYRVIRTVSIVMGVSFLLMKSVPIGQICLFFVWLGHMIYFLRFVKTKEDIPETYNEKGQDF